ncbi:hypothetical protein [Actinoplanes derwentensis]|uniref:Peptidase family M48 n=1 Tax=Actinoplanes derwentensis TaxID=113562 RepID=A0A1H2A0B7_9ACTN|nr:hypothetical protein [Actinoplanes derwentensis]SDT39448.1 hypothetical protein SAMN04489716_3598 [Actinoplanes derwentensis]
MARRRLDDLRIERIAIARRALADMRANGDAEAADYQQHIVELFESTGHDPVEDILDQCRSQVVDAMASLGQDRARLRLVEVGGIPGISHTAAIVGFLDGSAMVRVSDTLTGLIDMYARHLTPAMVPDDLRAGLRVAFRRFRTGRAELDEELLALSLRVHMIHCRILALPATPLLNLDFARQIQADRFAEYGIRLVLAHELAHHALGQQAHDKPGVTACTGDASAEREADDLAFRAVLTIYRGRGDLLLHAVLGMVAAMMALYAVESSQFARIGTSHPSAEQRMEHLFQVVPFAARGHVQMFGRVMAAATSRANLFAPGSDPALPWQRLRDDPKIHRHPFSLAFLDEMAAWDRMQSEDVAAMVVRAVDLSGEDTTVVLGLTDLFQAGPAAALRSWGAADTFLTRVADPAVPISFSALRREIERALPAHRMPRLGVQPVTDRLALLTELRMREETTT